MSKNSTINCDICGTTVATKADTIFARYDVIIPYVEVPYHYQGIRFVNGVQFPVPSKTEKHICNNCMEKFVYKAIDEKKEQSK